MSYKIIDFEGETVESGFVSYTAAWLWMHDLFTDKHIKNMEYKIIRED